MICTDRRTNPHDDLLHGKNLNRSADYSNTKTCKSRRPNVDVGSRVFGVFPMAAGKGQRTSG